MIAGGIVVVLIAAIAMAGCGGSSSDAGETEASKTFLSAKGKNKIVKFGEEADADEREAASEVLEENLKAREAGKWAKQCASLTVSQQKEAEETVNYFGNNNSCVRSLLGQATPVSASAAKRANTMTGPIDALRVKGDRGYALYHGAKGKDYAIPMKKEDGEWKVDAIVTTELP